MNSTIQTAALALQTTELTKRFGDILAVDRVSISARIGEILGLIGPNGAGKSTLIKMLSTLLPVTSGRAMIAGHDVAAEPAEVRRRIGYVPQLVSADGSLTGYENLLLSARLYAIRRAQRRDRIRQALEVMGLAASAEQLVQHYSGGMIRRLEIAQSLLHEPEVMFLDEPTVGLDPVARQSVWQHVLHLKDVLRTTMLVTTHYMEEADDLCDRIALIHHGRISAGGTPAELKAQVGPDATLDDVFAHLAGTELQSRDDYKSARRTRASARSHA
ncbi:MAG TPA: ATP-binding cassette domain-containing protein [Dongiaceae bacterium]|jgi:ABC-2 type transport system ATP-binding protein|nr:ATP-binding cassette domain-containing protein [Dongiaceae bacterium]